MSSTEEVLISYSHDSPEHIRSILGLSNRLRDDGVDSVLDQYEASPPEGWPRWMDKKIRDAKYVVLICTETYYKRVMGEEEPGTGHGVKWEGHLIYQHLYEAGTLNTRFLPVVTRRADKRFVPDPLRASTIYALDTPGGYDDLYARLTGTAGALKPPLGKRRALPARPVKTDPVWFITSPIDVELWDKARWIGTFFLYYEGRPPLLGLAFKDEGAAREIFRQWHQRYGASDVDEELRISIVEGDVDGEEPGYTVHVSSDIEGTINRRNRSGYSDDDIVFSVSRLNRMNPAPGSTYLQMFRELYRQFKTYYLIPGVITEQGSLKPIPELRIFKNKVFFRHVDDIKDNDVDAVVVGTGKVKRPKNPDYSVSARREPRSGPTTKTKSELLFEQLCREHDLRCEPVPRGRKRTPDYDVYFGPQQVVVEVKQIEPTGDEAVQIAKWQAGEVVTFGGEPGRRVRQEITDARKQLRRAKGKFPALLVLYNTATPPFHALDPMFILLAMYGELILPIATPKGAGKPVGGDLRFGGKRRVSKTDNTTLSAVCVLIHDPEDPLILTFYHNYFAALPFNPEWFKGERVRHYFLPKSEAESGGFGFWVDIDGKPA